MAMTEESEAVGNGAAQERPGRSARAGARRSSRGRGRAALRVVALVALWAVPLGAVVVSVPLRAVLDAESVAAPEPVTVTVGSREVDRAVGVNAVVTRGTQPEIRSAGEGFVTALAGPGPIEQGAEVFAVGGVPVLAYRGPVLHRDLGRGDRGPDVAALGEYLVALDLLDASRSDDRFGPGMHAAVRDLQERLGVERDGVFRLSYVAYVPEDAFEVEGAVVRLGDRVGAGEAVLVAAAPVESVVLSAVAMGVSLASYEGAGLVLRLGSEGVEVSGVEVGGEEATSLAAALRDAVGTGGVRVDGGEGGALSYSGPVLALRDPPTSGVVPSTAVVIDAQGRSCVVVDEGGGREPLVLASAVPGSELGTVVVDDSVIGRQVVRDASTLGEGERSCG